MSSIDEKIKMRFQSNKHRMLLNMIYTSNWIHGLLTQKLKPFGVSAQQFNVLRILRGANDWKSMNEIKSLMIDKTPNTTRLSDKLLDKGLIDRQRCDHDRRVVYLRINEKGHELLRAIDEEGNLDNIALLSHISEEEAQKISDIIDQIRY